MKALPMLDHVLLWYGRSSFAVFLAFAFFILCRVSYVICRALPQIKWRWNESFTPLLVAYFAIFLVMLITNISLWRPHKFLCRFFLFLAGSTFLLFGGLSACADAFTMDGAFWKMGAIILVFAIFAGIWVSIRPSEHTLPPNAGSTATEF